MTDLRRNAEIRATTNYESRVRANSLTSFNLLLLVFLFSFYFSSSYDAHAGWMTFAENGGFLMALLFAHFISSRVHRRVTRAHRLAVSLPCTRILKNNHEFSAFMYCENLDFGTWLVKLVAWIRIKRRTQMNKLLEYVPSRYIKGK